MATGRTKVGIIGCGNISGVYFKNCQQLEGIQVTACADLDLDRARTKAAEHQVPRACTVKELLSDPEIQIVVNLTIPKAHAEVNLAAIAAGKHVYVEKPLGVSRAEGQQVLEAAQARGVRVGCAPDTFLGGGLQTCRKLLDDGWIGRPVAGTARMLCRGHEGWHPAPEFYYQAGGGPMLDMGPYYVTALVSLLGSVRRVTGFTGAAFAERTIASAPKFGTRVRVEVPTHVAGVLEFESGALVTLVTSFDVYEPEPLRRNAFELYGTLGSIQAPDPNNFRGPVGVFRPGSAAPRVMVEAAKDGVEVKVTRAASAFVDAPLSHGYTENFRGLGVADLAAALRSKRPHRASGELAFHVLDVMQALHEAAASGKALTLASRCARPAPLPLGLRDGQIDD